MRKFAIALGIMAAVLFAGVAWKADATTWRSGTLNLPSAAKNYSPIENTACYGWGRHCPQVSTGSVGRAAAGASAVRVMRATLAYDSSRPPNLAALTL